jgi:hypothetical protein
MKRIGMLMFVASCLVAGMVIAAMAAEQAKPKGNDITVTGQMSCTNCKLAQPGKSCPKGCCEMCVKAGDPVMLTDAKGNMYILLKSGMGESLMNEERMKLLGSQVTVKGVLVKGKGVQGIYVDTMEKAMK